jgi:cellulose synthase/poly-beta-1,6-N-acetylglucosamine synthase-like glycosyltransferase
MDGMTGTLTFAIVAAAGFLWYVFDGYWRLLGFATRLGSRPCFDSSSPLPTVTVLIAVWNEANVINARIDNILACDYPPDRLRVVVASDGSNDGTDQIVSSRPEPSVHLVCTETRRGKTAAQNLALQGVRSEVVVFTDALAEFDGSFLQKITAAFSDASIGAATGRMILAADAAGEVAFGQSTYWDREQAIRQMESDLGLLAVASGAGLAVRRELIKPMREDVGEDCLLPLQVAEQGKRIVHVHDAIVVDSMPSTVCGEFKTRVRMTARNWIGTWSHPGLLNPLHQPRYAFSLWSHKVMRWLSPVALFGLLVLTSLLATVGGLWTLVSIVPISIGVIGALGWVATILGIRVPIAGSVFSFLLANAGFLCGLLSVVIGRRFTTYRSRDSEAAASKGSGAL